MNEIKGDNNRSIPPEEALALLEEMISRPSADRARDALETEALKSAYESMRRYGTPAGVAEKQLAMVSYLARHPAARIWPEPIIMAALEKARSCLMADVMTEHAARCRAEGNEGC